MATKGVTGRGTVFSIGVAGSPETFTPIMNMRTYSFSGNTVKFDDISNLNSSVNGGVIVEESIPASEDPGTFTASGIWIPSDAGQTALAAAWGTHGLTDFKVQFPIAGAQTTTGNLYTFSGFLQDNPLPDADYSKAITIKFAIKLNTAITPTVGS